MPREGRSPIAPVLAKRAGPAGSKALRCISRQEDASHTWMAVPGPLQCQDHKGFSPQKSPLLFRGAAICAFLRFSGGGGVMGAARRGCGGICKETFHSNQRRQAIKTFCYETFFLACVNLPLHLSHRPGKFSQEDGLLIGSFLEEQSRTHTRSIPSL